MALDLASLVNAPADWQVTVNPSTPGFVAAKRAGVDAGAAFLRAHPEKAPSVSADDIPVGSMRVAPGTDAVVWRINPEHSGEL